MSVTTFKNITVYYKVVRQDDSSCMVTNPLLQIFYKKDRTITAHPDSIGIMAFLYRSAAESFINQHWPAPVRRYDRIKPGIEQESHVKIKRVKSIGWIHKPGKGIGVHQINEPVANDGEHLEFETVKGLMEYVNSHSGRYDLDTWPPGTLCLEGCLVLD